MKHVRRRALVACEESAEYCRSKESCTYPTKIEGVLHRDLAKFMSDAKSSVKAP